MEILILGRGVSATSLYKVLSKENNVKYAIEKYESLDVNSIYKDEVNINDFDMFYISPGVKHDDPLFIKIKENNKDYSSELEYALNKLIHNKIIAITGSNGKTTVASLLYFMLKKKDINCILAGNIGDPLVNYLNVSKDTIIILEISSFQLELIRNIKPYISIITNISENHLDRHTFIEYIDLKKKITKYQDKNDYLLVNKLTNNIYNIKTLAKKKIIYYKKIINKHLIGYHNYQNIAFVDKVLKILKIKNYRKYFKEFKGVKYRLEYLGMYNKTLIYNDAKSTTPSSTLAAVKCFGYNTLLILGGKNKNIDYSSLEKIKVKKIIMYGEEARINTNSNIQKFKDLNDVFNYLKLNINKYKVILHSPAFTSFDLYNNYKERGEDFERLFKENF